MVLLKQFLSGKKGRWQICHHISRRLKKTIPGKWNSLLQTLMWFLRSERSVRPVHMYAKQWTPIVQQNVKMTNYHLASGADSLPNSTCPKLSKWDLYDISRVFSHLLNQFVNLTGGGQRKWYKNSNCEHGGHSQGPAEASFMWVAIL